MHFAVPRPSTGERAQGQSCAACGSLGTQITPCPDIPEPAFSKELLSQSAWPQEMRTWQDSHPQGFMMLPLPFSHTKSFSLKEGSGHERGDKAYHYSRLWIITGLDRSDWLHLNCWINTLGALLTFVCPVGKCSLNWLNWAKPALHWPHSSCQATVKWCYNPSMPWSSHGHRGITLLALSITGLKSQ